MSQSDPHEDGKVLTGGAALGAARAAMILVHGRGGRSEERRPSRTRRQGNRPAET